MIGTHSWQRALSAVSRSCLMAMLAVPLSGCGSIRSVLDPAGPVSALQRQLLFEAVGVMLIVVLPVFILAAVFIWRYRAADPKGRYTPDWDHSVRLEIGVWVVPLLIVVALGVLIWVRTHQLDPYKPIAATTAPLTVEVVSLDWQWLFIYPEQNIGSLNRLVIPAGRPVKFEITSDSVMTAFWIPALGSQIYAMAGMRTQLNLLADAPGQLVGRNTQFNGIGFSDQHFAVDAVRESDFDAFVANARATGPALDSAAYDKVRQPTVAGSVQSYSAVAPHLFDTIIASYGASHHH